MTSNDRKRRGRAREGADFPVAPPAAELPGDYAEALEAIRARVTEDRAQTLTATNRVLARTHHELGSMLQHRRAAGQETQLTDTLPDELEGSLPTVEELEAELSQNGGAADE